MKSNVKYRELAKAQITETRNVVISSINENGFTIAQQLVAQENNKPTVVFLRGAFHVDDIQGLYNLRDAINLAIKESEKEPSADWDE